MAEGQTAVAGRTGVYEVMFLVGQGAAADFGGLLEHIDEIIGRASAEVVAMSKWDERRLAYEIDKQKRGVYILAYLRCPTDGVAKLERDCQLSERIMRCLVVKADHLSEDEMLATDKRDELKTEARLRAERSERDAESGQRQTVTLGAPPKEEEAPAEGEAPSDGDGSSGEAGTPEREPRPE